MKVKYLVLLTLFIAAKYSFAGAEFAGYWHGAVNRLGSIQLIEFNFYNGSSSLKGTYNIPDMGLYEEPVEEIRVENSSFKFKIFMGYFDTYLDTVTGEITGSNEEWNPPLNIHLKRMLKPVSLFNKENISFFNRDTKIAGTLFKPHGKSNFPVVLIIHGSDDPQSRRNWRYRYFAYLLASNGFGAFIYDKQGADSSSGNKDADFFELAEDVNAGIKHLSSRNDVDKNKIGVLGISRGGWVAEICAARFDGIAFAVLFLGPSVSVWEQQTDAVEFQMREEYYPEETIDSALRNNKLYFEAVKDKNKWNSFRKSLITLGKKEWTQYLQLPESYNDSDMVWWRKNNYNPEDDLKNTKCPVLSLMSEMDVLVPPERNFNRMKLYLSESGEPFEIKIIPGLPHNIHYFQTLRGGKWEWPHSYWVWPKKSKVLEETVINWLNKVCSD